LSRRTNSGGATVMLTGFVKAEIILRFKFSHAAEFKRFAHGHRIGSLVTGRKGIYCHVKTHLTHLSLMQEPDGRDSSSDVRFRELSEQIAGNRARPGSRLFGSQTLPQKTRRQFLRLGAIEAHSSKHQKIADG